MPDNSTNFEPLRQLDDGFRRLSREERIHVLNALRVIGSIGSDRPALRGAIDRVVQRFDELNSVSCEKT